jgi:NDP-sugar pyrophosphorylase family protein
MADVNGRPFLAYLLDQLKAAGVRRTVLCTGYLGGQVKETFGNDYRGIELLYSEERAPLGTGGAVRLALPLLDSDPVIIMNGDSFCDANLDEFLIRHRTTQAKASLLLTRVPDVGRYGAVKTTSTGEIVAFEEKCDITGPGLINAGVYLVSPTVFQVIDPEVVVSLERDIFPGLINNGLYGFQETGKFLDIGIPEDYDAAKSFFLEEALDSSGQERI